ncbi:MAG: type II secretion system F family protein [Azospirillum sp.]|nr:type II secretion system F family protein [Azospirillum sp.]
MLDRLFNFILNPESMIVLAAVCGTFMTVLTFVMPYLKRDVMGDRLKAAARRRQDLHAQQMEALQRKSKLRRDRPSLVRELVDRFKLRDLLAGPELRAKLLQANWRDPNAVAIFAGTRALAPIVLCGVISLYLFGTSAVKLQPQVKLAIAFGAVIAGVYLPNVLMHNAIQKRQQAFSQAFPDALDLLLICVESGLSIEAAFGRVAGEIGESSPELAEEFEMTTAELAYLTDRRIPFENLTLRTGLPTVKAVCTTLIQAEKYGTPLTAALRIAAGENRDRRMAAAEKKAHALPAMLTAPMIIFFLPVLFLVILGPVFIQLTSR